MFIHTVLYSIIIINKSEPACFTRFKSHLFTEQTREYIKIKDILKNGELSHHWKQTFDSDWN